MKTKATALAVGLALVVAWPATARGDEPRAPATAPPAPATAAPAPAAPAAPAANEAPSDSKDEAIARFKRGLELYGEGDQTAALIEFRKAYALAPHYRVLYNIGQVCFDLQDYACALQSFERYVREGGTAISSERRAQVDKDLARLRTRVARVEIATNVPGASITVDDVEIGTTPFSAPVVVSAGKRRIGASKEGRIPVTRIIDVAGTDSVRVDLDLVEPKGAGASVAAAPAATPSRWTTASWVGLGVGGALTGAAIVTGVVALNATHTMQNERFVGDTPSASVSAESSKAKGWGVATDVLAIAAAGTIATTLVLTFALSPSEKPRAAVVVSPTGLAMKGEF